MYKRNEIEKMVKGLQYYDTEDFIRDAKRYIKAIEEGRIICNVESVSRSGMSRKMKFLECSKNKNENRYSYLNFYAFFKSLGFSFGDRDTFNVSGCGMDMVFSTNYDIIHTLSRLGFLSDDKTQSLAQATPQVI